LYIDLIDSNSGKKFGCLGGVDPRQHGSVALDSRAVTALGTTAVATLGTTAAAATLTTTPDMTTPVTTQAIERQVFSG
jgi:hypothetical protein